MKKTQLQILQKIKAIYSNTQDFSIYLSGFEASKKTTTFRVNTLKSSNQEIENTLEEKSIPYKKIPFLEHGYQLLQHDEQDLWDLGIVENGSIYLQSLSSQLPVELLGDFVTNKSILDITAAPGGKTSQTAAYMKNTGEIIAVENNMIRKEKLEFTLNRQGVNNTTPLKIDARNLLQKYPKYEEYFDVVIADLPCSAEGKMNFNREKSYAYWNEAIPKKNAKLQKQILKTAVSALKPGGRLVYSTCAISPEENEDIVHFLLCNFPELSLLPIHLDYKFARKGLSHFENKHFKKEIAKNVVRVLPSPESEGFFVAYFEKKKHL